MLILYQKYKNIKKNHTSFPSQPRFSTARAARGREKPILTRLLTTSCWSGGNLRYGSTSDGLAKSLLLLDLDIPDGEGKGEYLFHDCQYICSLL